MAFAMAVAAIVAGVDLVLLFTLGASDEPQGAWQPFAAGSLQRNSGLLTGGALVTVAVIGLASLFKTFKLRTGGGAVARELGATEVESDPGDPLKRRLRNVVEEIALASGVPVPEIHVMEREDGINAFAAGYTPADAAVTVTRGALEKLSRDELQGVIAHEFSHILNGDMRINIRLMGALFGILLLALIGRRVMEHTRILGGSRDKGAVVLVLIAFGVMAIGYIGLFFGRWIKAAVSRQREYLADASAVQFTRDPDGIGGALKKIAVSSGGSNLSQDSEEISHMLFGDGRKMGLFSTHPPLLDRIRRIEPRFQEDDLDRFRARLAHEAIQHAALRIDEERFERARPGGGPGPAMGGFDAGEVIRQIGRPSPEQLLKAAMIASSLPGNIRQAAQSAEWAPEVLLFSLMDPDAELREQQLLLIAARLGGESESRVRALLQDGRGPDPGQRLALLELAFPALKRRPAAYLANLLAVIQELVRLDKRIDVFEYLLARLLSQYVWESQNPHQSRNSGARALAACLPEVARVLAVLAIHGGDTPSQAAAAWRAGMESLGLESGGPMPEVADWGASLDVDLPKLDRLEALQKQQLVQALLSTVARDGQCKPVELELIRVTCGLIHVPLPLLSGDGLAHTPRD